MKWHHCRQCATGKHYFHLHCILNLVSNLSFTFGRAANVFLLVPDDGGAGGRARAGARYRRCARLLTMVVGVRALIAQVLLEAPLHVQLEKCGNSQRWEEECSDMSNIHIRETRHPVAWTKYRDLHIQQRPRKISPSTMGIQGRRAKKAIFPCARRS